MKSSSVNAQTPGTHDCSFGLENAMERVVSVSWAKKHQTVKSPSRGLPLVVCVSVSMFLVSAAFSSSEEEKPIEVVKAQYDATSGEGIFCFVNASDRAMTAWTLRTFTRFRDGHENEGSVTEDRYIWTSPDRRHRISDLDMMGRSVSMRPNRIPGLREIDDGHVEGLLWPGQQHCIPVSDGPYPDRPLAVPPMEFEIVVVVYDNREFYGDDALADRIFKKRAVQAIQRSRDALLLRLAARRIKTGEQARLVLDEVTNERCPLLESEDPYVQFVAEYTHGQFLRAVENILFGDADAIEKRFSDLAVRLARDADLAYFNTTVAQFSAVEGEEVKP
jgi:hypothetical protein